MNISTFINFKLKDAAENAGLNHEKINELNGYKVQLEKPL